MTQKNAPKLSRRKSDLEKRGRYSDAPTDFKKLLRNHGLNPALPWLLMSSSGQVLYAVPRMLSILGIDRREGIRFPLDKQAWEENFHFFTEEHSKVAVLEKIVSKVIEQKSFVVLTENRMKTFRLFLKPVTDLGKEFQENEWFSEIMTRSVQKGKKSKFSLLFVEVMRAGDLLQDSSSRQTLFRSFAHELRTAVMSLSGMIEIALVSQKPQEQLLRMKESVKRIERIVDRLGELRARLGLDDKELERIQKELKKV